MRRAALGREMSPCRSTSARWMRAANRASPASTSSRRFQDGANAALDAENQPSDNSLVSAALVRGEILNPRDAGRATSPGDSSRAILARVEHRLESGDSPHPSGGRALMAPRGRVCAVDRRAEGQIAADEALARVEATLLTALGRGRSAKRGG